MTYFILGDEVGEEPWRLRMCGGKTPRIEKSLIIQLRLFGYIAKYKTNGFLPREALRRKKVRQSWLDLFIEYGQIHQRGEQCRCMRGHEWPEWADYHWHEFLKGNTSAEESDLDRAKKAELRDSGLRAQVFARDAHTCRYCGWEGNPHDHRSDRKLELDHVDPLVACGDANLVTACSKCNRDKGKRTPEQARMTLRPIPAPEPASDPAQDPTQDPAVGTPVSQGSELSLLRSGRVGRAPPRPREDPDPLGDEDRADPDDWADPDHDPSLPYQVGPPSTVRSPLDPNPLLRPDHPSRPLGIPSPAASGVP